jgi:hypothetical protein
MSTYLSRDQILAAQDLPREEVEVPEWGGKVLVQGMNGEDKDRFEASMVRSQKSGITVDVQQMLLNFRARLCAACIIDETGHKLFTDTDVLALGKKSAVALSRVSDVAQRLSAVSDSDVEELVGNSETDQAESSL